MNEFVSSDSDIDELEWSSKRRVKLENVARNPSKSINCSNSVGLIEKYQKFEELKKKSETIRSTSNQALLKAEKKRSRKLVKKAWKDPYIRKELEKNRKHINCCQEKEKEEWNTVKPFMSVNNHMHGPVTHGSLGPKNELESKIEDYIKNGNFEQAEILSDTLSNKQFAEKICKAFSAKRYQEKLDEQKILDKEQRIEKIRWTFEAKEKWQMKGNM